MPNTSFLCLPSPNRNKIGKKISEYRPFSFRKKGRSGNCAHWSDPTGSTSPSSLLIVTRLLFGDCRTGHI